MTSERKPEHHKKPTLSVVLPTLNCRHLLGDHIESMRPWMHLAEEIIVVDSHSDDGTVELIHEKLNHPCVKMYQRPRGLYQAWNFGISQVKSEFLYVSTVGDSITHDGIDHLLETARDLDADVVISQPDFIREDGTPIAGPTWPVEHIIKTLQIAEPRVLNTITNLLFQMLCLPDAILGSSASNIYRTQLMKENPFPVEYGTVGDGAWGLANFLKCSLAVTPRRFSTFREHEKSYSQKSYHVSDLNKRLFSLLSDTVLGSIANDGKLSEKYKTCEFHRILSLIDSRMRLQQTLEAYRRRPVHWILNPYAWRTRAKREYVCDTLQKIIFNELSRENPERRLLDQKALQKLLERRHQNNAPPSVFKNDITFLFYHYGRIPRYLKHAIEQVRAFNPYAEIHLITDGIKHVSGLEQFDIRHDSIGKYESEKLTLFRNVYRHISCFDEKFERFVLERWFVTEIIRKQHPNRIYIMQDSDVAVFGDVGGLLSELPDFPILLSGRNPHFTFIKGDISGFLNFITAYYLDQHRLSVAQAKFNAQGDRLFTLGEMQFLFEYLDLEKDMRNFNVSSSCGFVDSNLHMPQGFDSLQLRRRPRKKVFWKLEEGRAIPYFKQGDDLVRAFALHFQGPGKRVFHRFNSIDGATSPLQVWWWNQIFQKSWLANLM